MVSFSLLGMPTLLEGGSLSPGQTLLAGFIASSTMMIPRVSGSAVLIILAKVLKTLFSKYQSQILFFFSGLILGSARMLFLSEFGVLSLITFMAGVGVVYKWGRLKYK
ncbi:hypothetical protein Amet_0238 [Alkaliphilus metalliredigens QYMF]|uniref:Uncharacterized protein n=1 Tax=Alkaliphilus metalliredigens (strain QYMF) TaxID=293826 RepID=A6TJV3_ALKMQ|nr:hypothetical protein [Alkaliphilus metalliredigens]ABR46471.1 hypothetical protein Amet_0238 [Alkaliphilus metalliredigens QYMF]